MSKSIEEKGVTASKPIEEIGRKMGNSPLNSMLNAQEVESRTFTLASGKKVVFTRQHIYANELKEKTFADPTINGRDQSTLTEESLQDILRTIHLQQFFPAIGRKVEEKIEILDGSRRRAACLVKGIGLDVLVASENINVQDARQLAADLQTAKEHNLRELGMRFKFMEDNGMTRREIAKAEGVSAAKVTRAFQAASVPTEMIAFFPIVSELTLTDYKFLLDMAEEITKRQLSLDDILAEVQTEMEKAEVKEEAPDAVKNAIMNHFRDVKLARRAPRPVSPEVVTLLSEFEDKRIYARRKENPKNRTLVYEFSRLDKDLQFRIDKVVQEIFESYNKDKSLSSE